MSDSTISSTSSSAADITSLTNSDKSTSTMQIIEATTTAIETSASTSTTSAVQITSSTIVETATVPTSSPAAVEPTSVATVTSAPTAIVVPTSVVASSVVASSSAKPASSTVRPVISSASAAPVQTMPPVVPPTTRDPSAPLVLNQQITNNNPSNQGQLVQPNAPLALVNSKQSNSGAIAPNDPIVPSNQASIVPQTGTNPAINSVDNPFSQPASTPTSPLSSVVIGVICVAGIVAFLIAAVVLRRKYSKKRPDVEKAIPRSPRDSAPFGMNDSRQSKASEASEYARISTTPTQNSVTNSFFMTGNVRDSEMKQLRPSDSLVSDTSLYSRGVPSMNSNAMNGLATVPIASFQPKKPSPLSTIDAASPGVQSASSFGFSKLEKNSPNHSIADSAEFRSSVGGFSELYSDAALSEAPQINMRFGVIQEEQVERVSVYSDQYSQPDTEFRASVISNSMSEYTDPF